MVIDLKNYIKENKNQIIYLIFITILTYFIKIFNYSVSIDSEVPVNNPNASDYPWISMGRWGVVLLEKIFHFGNVFNPFLSNVIMVIFLVLTVILLSYLIDKITDNKIKYTISILGSFVVTSPLLAEMMNFTLMNAEVSLGLFLLVLSVYLTYISIYECKKKFYLFSIIVLCLTMGIYQSFYPLYIGLISFVFTIEKLYNNKNDGKQDIKNILSMVLVFIISYIFCYVISKTLQLILSIEPSTYLTSQICWGKVELKSSILNILRYIKMIVFPKNIGFFNYSYLIIIIISFIYAVKLLKDRKYIIIVTMLFSLFTPFLLEVILGNTSAYRTQMNLPFIIGMFTTLYICMTDKAYNKKILYLFTIIICMIQIKFTNDLFYSDYNRYQEDVRLTQDIMNKIDNLDDISDRENTIILFVGIHIPKSTSVPIRGETLGHSFYEWDEATDYQCNYRIYALSSTLGYKYILPTPEQIDEMKKIKETLEIYPKKDAIKIIDNIVVVRLS